VISNFFPNIQGDKVALLLSPNGSENAELLIIDLNGKKFPETIDRCSTYLVSWFPDGNSFTYHRYNSSDIKDINRQMNTKTYLHTAGTSEDSDIEYFSSPTNPELGILPEEIPFPLYDDPSGGIFALVVTVDKSLKIYSANRAGTTSGKKNRFNSLPEFS
jgi:prolyl oligopeptidase